MKTLHLFAGAGWGLLADLILGHRPVCAVEIEKYCCDVLRQRAAEGWFPDLHVHEGDARMFDPSPWCGRVDCISAGFPCQDISVAGGGAGIDGEKSGLWSEVVRCAGVIRPRLIFLENSPAITSRGLGRVLGDLAALGYDTEWCVLSASEVGAPHKRERWWLLASNCYGDERQSGGEQYRRRIERGKAAASFNSGGDVVANASVRRLGRENERQGQQQGRTKVERTGEVVADSHCERFQEYYAPAVTNQSRQFTGTLVAERGISWWSAEPDVGRVAHGVASRVDRIKALGNGQVPLQAAMAFTILRERISRWQA